eukprot:m.53103 g.53103  ORF g.53103 m.53103 type:complete len:337 (+) comp11354_c1_seq1:216-1226(+)
MCEHYARHCQIKAACCGQYYPCRLCHDKAQNPACPSEMNRQAVMQIECQKCQLKQMVNESCVRCGQRFGEYFCGICRFFDANTKPKYHCFGCGMCRVGGRENFKHCDTCRVCYTQASFSAHRCIENATDRNCPVCLEHLHTSTRKFHIPKCGHILHMDCFQELVRSSATKCPLCQEPYFNAQMFGANPHSAFPMPPEFQNHRVHIQCDDCNQKSFVQFHMLGNRCAHCDSLRTCRLGDPVELEAAPGGQPSDEEQGAADVPQEPQAIANGAADDASGDRSVPGSGHEERGGVGLPEPSAAGAASGSDVQSEDATDIDSDTVDDAQYDGATAPSPST